MDKKQKISWGVSFGSVALVAGMVSYLGLSDSGKSNNQVTPKIGSNNQIQQSQGGLGGQFNQGDSSGQSFGDDNSSQFQGDGSLQSGQDNGSSQFTPGDGSASGNSGSNNQFFSGNDQQSQFSGGGHHHGFDTTTGGT